MDIELKKQLGKIANTIRAGGRKDGDAGSTGSS
jgi:hypothetical protein